MANDEELAQAKVTEKVSSINVFFLIYFLCLASLSPIDKWPNRRKGQAHTREGGTEGDALRGSVWKPEGRIDGSAPLLPQWRLNDGYLTIGKLSSSWRHAEETDGERTNPASRRNGRRVEVSSRSRDGNRAIGLEPVYV